MFAPSSKHTLIISFKNFVFLIETYFLKLRLVSWICPWFSKPLSFGDFHSIFDGEVDQSDARGSKEQSNKTSEIGEEIDDVVNDHFLDHINNRTSEQKLDLKIKFKLSNEINPKTTFGF
jgi:hypothetical protein